MAFFSRPGNGFSVVESKIDCKKYQKRKQKRQHIKLMFHTSINTLSEPEIKERIIRIQSLGAKRNPFLDDGGTARMADIPSSV